MAKRQQKEKDEPNVIIFRINEKKEVIFASVFLLILALYFLITWLINYYHPSLISHDLFVFLWVVGLLLGAIFIYAQFEKPRAVYIFETEIWEGCNLHDLIVTRRKFPEIFPTIVSRIKVGEIVYCGIKKYRFGAERFTLETQEDILSIDLDDYSDGSALKDAIEKTITNYRQPLVYIKTPS